MSTKTAPKYFHVGIATDPTCTDWKTVSDSLDYAVKNRVAAYFTIVAHDITPWGSTKIALLWALANGHQVEYTPRDSHCAIDSSRKRITGLRAEGKLDAIAFFHNNTTPAHDNISTLRAQIGITARDINAETKAAIALAQQERIPTRLYSFTELDKEPALYPHRNIQSGQLRPYGPSYKIGCFYAPKATEQTARAWIWSCIEPFGNHFGDYQLTSLKVDADGWWRYELEREWLD